MKDATVPKMSVVHTVDERGERSFWTRVGTAFINRDGSINVKFDAVPVNGTVCLRAVKPGENAQ
jgi:hypothetical protein